MLLKAQFLLTALLVSAASSAQVQQQPVSPTTEVFANFRARLTKADPTQTGDLIFVVSAESGQGERATIRIPLASTGHPYGEERTCRLDGSGHRELVYTAGLEEVNYMPFRAGGDFKDFHFLLNKYLCRLLAAPFRCDGRELSLTSEWSTWKLGRDMHVDLSSQASATMDTTHITTLVTGEPFDHARCAAVAPSGGFCCVSGHTTEWHCGGTPATPGWEQVSGECFHRETAVACHDGAALPTLPRLWP